MKPHRCLFDDRSGCPSRRRTLALAFLLAALLAAAPAGTEPREQRVEDRATAMDTVKLLEAAHLTGHKLDDEYSRRIYHQFFQSLDPLKAYFLDSDMREFAAFETRLDDRLRIGDLEFAYRVYKRYLERIASCVKWAEEFAAAPLDPKQADDVILDGESATWAKDEDEARRRWRGRIHYEILSMLVDGTTEAEARKRIEKRYRFLAKDLPQLTDDELVEMYLNALATAFDPHTSYMGSRTLEDFRISIELSLEGIGALLTQEDGLTVVRELVPGGAADLDGRLKAGDRIVGVGEGADGEIVDVIEMRQREVVKRIRGKAGTIVRLEVLPAGQSKRSLYAVTRRKIELKERGARGEVVETQPEGATAPLKIGVITLPSFYADPSSDQEGGESAASATHDMRRLLGQFREKKVDGVVVDLRSNGGGLLPEAISVTGLFIDQGPVVQVKDRKGKVTAYPDADPGVAWDGPLVLLESRFSASASEIFAGAIQDYGRGLIVGDAHTHGKGTVQRVLDLAELLLGSRNDSSLGALKLTIEQFYRPSGESTQTRGVVADVVLPSWTDDDRYGEAKAEYALAFDRIGKASYAPSRRWTADQLRGIREASRARLAARPGLAAYARHTERLRERLARKVLHFDESTLREDRRALVEDDPESAEAAASTGDGGAGGTGAPAAVTPKPKPFGATPYTQEVLEITAALVRAHRQ
ncbi:MAG: carboxy terminal-processing peptidase [Planctomycetes bacterium]|nr:carboxy terminal-processing peptidase [Planctomycetota bacterium]